MQWMHVLQVETTGLVVTVTLNDVEVFADWEGARRITQTLLDPYVVEGDNRLNVALTPMTDDEGRPLGGDTALTVTLLRGEHGRDPGDEGRVARFVWNPTETPVEPGTLTGVWARQFTVRPEHAHGRWAWQDAPVRVPDASDAAALVGLTGEIHAALTARDLGAVLALTALRDRELARATGLSDDEMLEGLRDLYGGWFAEPDFALAPFDPGALAATAFARGRLVRITDAWGGPAIQGFGGGRRFAFTVIATRLDGRWMLAR